MRWSAAFACAAILLAACGGSPAEARLRRSRVVAEGRALVEKVDALEERLLADQARVRFWKELRARHESVSAIACTDLSRHAEGMARYAEEQQEKRDARARKNRVAARFVPASR